MPVSRNPKVKAEFLIRGRACEARDYTLESAFSNVQKVALQRAWSGLKPVPDQPFSWRDISR